MTDHERSFGFGRRGAHTGAFSGAGVVVAAALVVAGALCAAIAPLIALVVETMRAGGDAGDGWWAAAGRTVLVCMLIGIVGVVGGWFIAIVWVSSRRLGMLAFGMLAVPTFLAYAGWSGARAPGTVLGDALGRAASNGEHWIPVLVGEAFAVLAMGVWCAPLAALPLVGSIREGRDAWHARLLEPGGPIARTRTLLAVHRQGFFVAGVLCAAVAAGSAVPLHLAQFDTISILVWRGLADMSPSAWGALKWPVLSMVLVGWIAAWAVWRAAVPPIESSIARVGRPSWASLAVFVCVIVVGIVIPVWMMTRGLRSSGAMGRFWTNDAEALWGSVGVALLVTASVAMLTAATLAGLSAASVWIRRLTQIAGLAFLASGLTPGVLVGAGVLVLGQHVPATGLFAEVMIGLARFGFIGVITARWLAASRPIDARDQDRVLGGGLWAWWQTRGRPAAAVVIGAAVIAGCLMLHEIEASVMVVQPGAERIAPRLLGYLHFARLEELSAAVLWLLAGLLIPMAIAIWLLGREPERGSGR